MRTPEVSAGCRIVDLSRKCRKCGGLLDVELWPAHAAGCNCDSRKETRELRSQVNAMSLEGAVDPMTIQRLIAGEWRP